MPVVPKEEMFVQSVMPAGFLATSNIHASPADFGAQAGQALKELGQQGQLTGDMIERHAGALQELKNISSANDSYANKFDPAARQIYMDYLALKGKDADAAFPEYRQKMQDLASNVREGLDNDVQRKLFDPMAMHRMQLSLDDMAHHRVRETLQWMNDSTEAMAASFSRRIVDQRNDFDSVAGSEGLIEGVKRLYSKWGALRGEDSAVSDWQASAAIDKGLSDAVLTEAQTNPAGAKLLYDRYAQFMSSDPVRQHVMNNILPAVRKNQSQDVYADVIRRFGLMEPHSDIDGALKWLMDPNNYKDQLSDPVQRTNMAKMIQGAWNCAERFHKDRQSTADSSFTNAVANGEIAGLDLEKWTDPKTELAPSGDILKAAIERGAKNPIEPGARDKETLANLVDELSKGSMSDRGPINEAYLRSLITDRDFKDLSGLYDACNDPVKSRWFDHAREAFHARYADANGSDGVNPDAMKLFPRYFIDLHQMVRDQDLKGAQIRDSSDKMLRDIDRVLVGQWFGSTSPALDFANNYSAQGPGIGPVDRHNEAPGIQTPQNPQETPPVREQPAMPSRDQAGLEWIKSYMSKAYGGRIPLTDNNLNAAYDQFKTQDPIFWKNWKMGE
jgi:hypothetical protein